MTLKNIYDKVSHILEKNLQFNKESVIALQSLNLEGFKRWHRCNCKYYLCLQLKLANILYNIEREKLDVHSVDVEYSPISLQEHLVRWKSEIQESLAELKELNKKHFEEVGCTSKIIDELVCCLLDDLGDIQRYYARCSETDWLTIYEFDIDKHIHEKMKHKEKDYD